MRENLKYCILIPTYNNEKTLASLVEGVKPYCKDIIVVNDGSTDNTSVILNTIIDISLIEYKTNQGKGYALREGFKKAEFLGFEYVITIDSDGQHEPENIPDLIEKLKTYDTDVVLMGSRNMAQAGIPQKSSFGNKFSSFWFWAETGTKLSDTQTGYRAYPIKRVNNLNWYTNRFEFEIEVIVRLVWSGVAICEVPVKVNYPEDRVTHFRPLADFIRISLLNTVLFTLAILWYLPKTLLLGKGENSVVSRLKREFAKNKNEPLKMSGSVGIGFFFGIFPIWGFQMLAALVISRILKLNSIIVLCVSNISIPPMIPLIIFLSFLCGSPFVAESAIIPDLSNITLESIAIQLYQYMIGACLLAVTAGIIGFAITYLLIKLRGKKAIG